MRWPLMDPAFVERALSRLRPVAHRDAYVALTARCAPQAFERLVSTEFLGERTLWDPRGASADLGPAMAGVGAVVRELEGGAHLRFQRVATRAQAVFRAMIEHRDAQCEAAPPPAFIGGASFAAGAVKDIEWPWFADEMFVLPRWRVALTEDGAFATWVLAVSELSDRPALMQELASANDVIARSPTMRLHHVVLREREELSRDQWQSLVEGALAMIREGRASKLVPARRTRLRFASTIDPVACVARASSRYRSCTRFLVEREERAFVGASPERLLSVRGGWVETDALAGSLPRSERDDVAELERALLASEKNRREHQAVVDAIVAGLRSVCEGFEAAEVPSVRTLSNVVHLWTPLRAKLRRAMHPLALLALLHPTPAVAGTPRVVALDWLCKHEPHPRGWFAGPVGWFDAQGDGAFVVGLRSMLVYRDQAWLYAGAGVVSGSDPALEYEETAAKMAAMSAALGL
jgi:menaquinone-specific isochorismate synthase